MSDRKHKNATKTIKINGQVLFLQKALPGTVPLVYLGFTFTFINKKKI